MLRKLTLFLLLLSGNHLYTTSWPSLWGTVTSPFAHLFNSTGLAAANVYKNLPTYSSETKNVAIGIGVSGLTMLGALWCINKCIKNRPIIIYDVLPNNPSITFSTVAQLDQFKENGFNPSENELTIITVHGRSFPLSAFVRNSGHPSSNDYFKIVKKRPFFSQDIEFRIRPFFYLMKKAIQ